MSNRIIRAYGAIAVAFASIGTARADTCAEGIRAYDTAVAYSRRGVGRRTSQRGRRCIASPRSGPSPVPMRRRRSMRSMIGPH